MNKKPLTIKDSSIAFISSFLICNILTIAVSSTILLIATSINPNNIENFSKSCIMNAITSSTLYLIMFLLFKFFNKNKDNNIFTKPSIKKSLIYSLIAIATFFALYPIVNSFDFLLSNLGFKLTKPSYNFTISNYFICLVPMTILPAICEELLFRGIIFKGLKSHGKLLSIALTSLMFAIYHMSIQQAIYPILFGLLLTSVMHKENNIFYTIIMHFINNLFALTLMFTKTSLFSSTVWYYVLAVVLAIIFIILLIFYIKSIKIVEKYRKIEKNHLLLLVAVLVIMFILWLISNIYR